VDLGRYVEVLILARAGDLMVKPSQVVLRSTAPWSPAEQDRSRVIAVQALETETSGGAGQ
jgi:hypothetical protein